MYITNNLGKELSLSIWRDKQYEASSAEVVSLGYPLGTSEHTKIYENKCVGINRLIAKVEDLVESKDIKLQTEMYPYFENMVGNRRTAFLFNNFTNISVGNTDKRALEAFDEYFGTQVSDGIKKAKKDELDSLKREKQEEKEKKRQETLLYFSNKTWDSVKVAKMTELQAGRTKKILNKLWNFDGNIQSLKENIESLSLQRKYITNNMYKWSRRRYNNMYMEEQNEYERKLIKGRTYFMGFDDKYSRDVPKIIFDLLDVRDVTNSENLLS